MKSPQRNSVPTPRPKSLLATLALLGLVGAANLATAQETWIYAARWSGAVWAPPFYTNTPGTPYAVSTGKSTAPGTPSSRVGCWYHTASSLGVGQGFGCQLTNDTAIGGVWKVYCTIPSSNGGTNLIMSVSSTNADWGAIDGSGPITQTDAFRSSAAANKWALIGVVTNRTTAGYSGLHPSVHFGYVSGDTGGGNYRSYADCLKFEKVELCGTIPTVFVRPPYTSNLTSVVVADVDGSANRVTVYQKIGAGAPAVVGTLTSGIVAGDNTVTVSGLVAGAQIMATQTIGLQEGCVAASGYPIGAGPNSQIRVSLNLGKSGTDSYIGPIGASGSGGSPGYYFMPNNAGTGASYPQGGLLVTPNTCWQTVKIDPRTASHGNIWAGSGTGDPGFPAWTRLDSIVFDLSDLGNSGPYAIYIDNLANGTTMIHDWEDAWEQGAATNAVPGLFADFPIAGSTYPLLNTNPLVSTVACSTNNSAPNQCAGGTNSQYVSWQWNQVGSPGVWLRQYCNAAGVANWPGWPQLDMNQPIYFDILVQPINQGPAHSVGSVGYMADQLLCPGQNATFSITATPPTDPNTGLPMPRTYTYQWKRNGVTIDGATDSSFTTNNAPASATGTYSVVVSDGTCSLERDAILTLRPFAEWNPNGRVVPSLADEGRQVINAGATLQITYNTFPVATSPCNEPLDYHWLLNGVEIPGATVADLYSVASASVADAGTYSLMVSNQYGSMIDTNISVWHVVAPDAVVGSGSGLLGAYWMNLTTTTCSNFPGLPTLTRTDVVDFAWNSNIAPDGSANTNEYSVRWVGKLQPPWAQTYRFYTTNDDGARLWIDGQIVIDSYGRQGIGTGHQSAALALNTGLHDITIDFYNDRGGSDMHLAWESPSLPPGIIPAAQLYANAAADWQPGISLDSPPDGTSAPPPASFTVSASVTTNSLYIKQVAFFTNNVLLATLTAPPYSYAWNNVPAGSYNVKATVTYNGGQNGETRDSAVHTVTVSSAAPPSITSMTSDGVNATIAGTGSAGQHYFLQKTTNIGQLPHPTWSNISTQGPAASFSFTLPIGSDASAFFRVGAY